MEITKTRDSLKLLYEIHKEAMESVGWKTIGFTLNNREKLQTANRFSIYSAIEGPPITFPPIYAEHKDFFADEILMHKDQNVIVGMLLYIDGSHISGKWMGCVPGIYHMSCSTSACTDVQFSTSFSSESHLRNAFRAIPTMFQSIVDNPNKEYIENGSDHVVKSYGDCNMRLGNCRECIKYLIKSEIIKVPEEYRNKVIGL